MRIRTTSALESYNARLGATIVGGSNFFKFTRCLIQEEAVKVIEFRELIRSGGAVKLSQKQTHRQEAIETGMQLLQQNVGTIEDFLSRVSYSPGTADLCDDFHIDDITDDPLVDDGNAHQNAPLISEPSTSRRAISGARHDDDPDFVAPPAVPSSSEGVSTRRGRRHVTQTSTLSTVNENSSAYASTCNLNAPETPENQKVCITCCDAMRSLVFLPCTHLILCQSCYDRQNNIAMQEHFDALESMEPERREESVFKPWCPMCKQTIEKVISPIMS